jgi:hypothetical protein
MATLEWIRQTQAMNTIREDVRPQIVTDSEGNSYVVYQTTGTVSGGESLDPIVSDIVLFKLDPSGSLLWIKQTTTMNTAGADGFPSITLDGPDFLYIAYQTDGVVSGGESAGDLDIVVCKFQKTDGTLVWVKQVPTMNTAAADEAPSITSDTSGNVYVTYMSQGVVSGGTLSGLYDIVVFKLDADGSLLWVKQNPTWNTTAFEVGPTVSNIITDSETSLYISYMTNGTVSGGFSAGDYDIVVMKLRMSDGAAEWLRQTPTMNTSQIDNAPRIAIDRADHLYVTYFTAGVVSGGEKVGNPSTLDVIIFKMTKADGSLVWISQSPILNTVEDDGFPGITTDVSGNVYLTYRTVGVVSGGALTANADIVVSKLNANGVVQWLLQQPVFNTGPGSSGSETPAIALDVSNNVYVTYTAYGVTSNSDSLVDYTPDIVVFKLRQTVPEPPTPQTGCAPLYPGGGDHSSVLTRRIRECYQDQVLAPGHLCPRCREPFTGTRVTHHTSESQWLMSHIAKCPFYYDNKDADVANVCPPSLLTRAMPTERDHYRKHPSIRGIQDICRPVRGRSASELTSRLKTTIVRIEKVTTRHGEHIRKHPPPPPCPVPQIKQPGVPLARITGCNPGNQRVDYSDPLA